MTFDLGLADSGQSGRPPLRRLVLVDDHRPDSLIEVVPSYHMGNYPVFGAHALVESERSAAPLQGERELEAERRLLPDRRRGPAGKVGFVARLGSADVEAGQNLFYVIRIEPSVDRRPLQH